LQTVCEVTSDGDGTTALDCGAGGKGRSTELLVVVVAFTSPVVVVAAEFDAVVVAVVVVLHNKLRLILSTSSAYSINDNAN